MGELASANFTFIVQRLRWRYNDQHTFSPDSQAGDEATLAERPQQSFGALYYQIRAPLVLWHRDQTKDYDGTMIERLQRLAVVLSRIRGLLLLLAGASFALLALSLISNPWITEDVWLMPSLAAMLWWLNLYSLSFLFITVPAATDEGLNWHQRLSRKIRRSAAWVAAMLFLILTGALALLTYQLLRVAFF